VHSIFLNMIGGAPARATGKVTPMSKGKVLVVMSSANALDLKDGKTYVTGYYLNEFVVPYRKLLDAGYEPVIANPKGNLPVMDANSNNAMFFGGDDAARADALKFAQGLELLMHPKTLASVVDEGTKGYVGLFRLTLGLRATAGNQGDRQTIHFDAARRCRRFDVERWYRGEAASTSDQPARLRGAARRCSHSTRTEGPRTASDRRRFRDEFCNRRFCGG
jgi:hypothetical protein